MTESNQKRVDTITKEIAVRPAVIYQAILNPEALVSWLPPTGMSGQIDLFEPWEGGRFRLTLTYLDPEYAQAGKTEENKDVSTGTFVHMIKDEQIVWEASFESEDATLRDTMRVTWYLKPIPIGTEVKIVCEDVPLSIPQQAHEDGWNSTLDNLAAFVIKKNDKNV